jgi:hypothetical protein
LGVLTPKVFALFLNIFETFEPFRLAVEMQLNAVERANQLREQEQKRKATTGGTNFRFIEMVEACIDCEQIDLSAENSHDQIRSQLQNHITGNGGSEQFFNILLQPETAE